MKIVYANGPAEYERVVRMEIATGLWSFVRGEREPTGAIRIVFAPRQEQDGPVVEQGEYWPPPILPGRDV